MTSRPRRGCDAYALHRVLTHLAQKGVFEEPKPGRFTLNDAARQLLDPITRLSLDLEDFGGRMAHAWSTLLPYVRTGEPAYQTVFGLPFWEDLDAHPEIRASFDAMMGPQGHGTPNPEFQITGGWESVRSVVDVGGGTGAMLAEILRSGPGFAGRWWIPRGRLRSRMKSSRPPVLQTAPPWPDRAFSIRCPGAGSLSVEESHQRLARPRGDGDLEALR